MRLPSNSGHNGNHLREQPPAYEVYREDCEALAHSSRDIDEIQRLMQGFAGELRKLEEGLRIVSAYVLRMHSKASRERRGLLH